MSYLFFLYLLHKTTFYWTVLPTNTFRVWFTKDPHRPLLFWSPLWDKPEYRWKWSWSLFSWWHHTWKMIGHVTHAWSSAWAFPAQWSIDNFICVNVLYSLCRLWSADLFCCQPWGLLLFVDLTVWIQHFMCCHSSLPAHRQYQRYNLMSKTTRPISEAEKVCYNT